MVCYLDHGGEVEDYNPKRHYLCSKCAHRLAILGNPGIDFDHNGTMVSVAQTPITHAQAELLDAQLGSFREYLIDFADSRELTPYDMITLLEYLAKELRHSQRAQVSGLGYDAIHSIEIRDE